VQAPSRLKRWFFAAWKRAPHRLRAVAVRVAVPRSAAGAGLLLFDREERVLLVRHPYQRDSAWSFPGGWARRGEELRATAHREAREELGVAVVVGAPLATGRNPFGAISVLFEARLADPDAELVLDDEISEARFFALDGLPPMFGHARRLLDDALEVRKGRRGGE
jgi:ADP-ribose pyrophosphatase YjhB (NUDIX family)